MTILSLVHSPVGTLRLGSDGRFLTGLSFDPRAASDGFSGPEDPVFRPVRKWLDIYFSGEIPDFMPEFRLTGTPLQMEVWRILQTIPYGQTVTYGDIASRIAAGRGIPRMSAQAVGNAVGKNPIAIIIPCHRVIGADGSLTGFAGGLNIKSYLLRLENPNFNFR